ncbi:hypothetical protein HK100_009537, partial [Physocladia obscura]
EWTHVFHVDEQRFWQRFTTNHPEFAMLMKDGPSWAKAIKDSKWIAAIKAELNQMDGVEAYHLEYALIGVKPLRWVWVLKIKVNAATGEEKYKAQLAVDGSTQVARHDFDKIYATIPAWEAVKIFKAIEVQHGMISYSADFVAAYL